MTQYCNRCHENTGPSEYDDIEQCPRCGAYFCCFCGPMTPDNPVPGKVIGIIHRLHRCQCGRQEYLEVMAK